MKGTNQNVLSFHVVLYIHCVAQVPSGLMAKILITLQFIYAKLCLYKHLHRQIGMQGCFCVHHLPGGLPDT